MANIVDVAKKAGVAISTVSNIINGTRYVSPETTAKVLRVIDELGYEADPVARTLKSVHSNMIGIIITNFSRVFFAPVLRSCRKIAAGKGYTLMCMESDDDFELEQKTLKAMKNNRFDAIILDTVSEFDNTAYFEHLRGLSKKRKPIAVVCIERDATAYGLDSVAPDNYDGAVLATEHLLGLGCRNILHITGPINSWPAEQRALGYNACMGGAKKEFAFGDFSPQSGCDVVKQVLARHGTFPYDGIFSSNDQMAVGAMHALREAGLRVPEDVRVVGFDNSFVASLIEPPLTSVNVSREDIGAAALNMAIERIENPGAPARRVGIKTNLVVRKSTNPAACREQSFISW